MKFLNTVFAKLLLSFFVISIIPLLLTHWFTYTNAKEELSVKLERETLNLLDQKLESLSLFLSDIQRMVDVMASNPSVSDFLKLRREFSDSAELNRAIASANEIRPENVGVTILNGHGIIHSFGYEASEHIQELYNERWLHSRAEDGESTEKVAISIMHDRPYSSDKPHQEVFSIVRQIGSIGTQDSGTVIIDFNIGVLRSLLKNIFLLGNIYNDNASGVLITDREDQLLYPYSAGTYTKADYDYLQENYFLIHRHDPLTGWNFTAYFLKSELYKPILKTRNVTLSIIMISILVCQIASLVISSRISKPILHLRRLMGKVGRGDFDVHYPYESRDEIGALGKGFNTMVRRIQDLIGIVYEEQNQKRRAEVAALQSQINPHFLYNTLESINSLARTNKQREISRMIVLLGKLLRMSIGTFDDMVTFAKEFDYVKHYLEIHKHRAKHEFGYRIDIDPQMYRWYTIKWILQPVIENALIHGVCAEKPNSFIEIKGWTEGFDVYIRISDQGIGMPESALKTLQDNLAHHAMRLAKQGGSIGLYNVQSRLQLNFGDPYGIRMESEYGAGTVVTFKLPRREKP